LYTAYTFFEKYILHKDILWISLSCFFHEFLPPPHQPQNDSRAYGCYGKKGRSEANFDDAVKLPDPENPTFGTKVLLLPLKMLELLLLNSP